MDGTWTMSREEAAALYRRHIGTVYQLCLMLMKNVPDAEDAAQTVFQRAMERKEPFRDPEHEKAWLIVTARNECRNQLKHWWRTRRASEETYQNLTWEQPEDGELWDRLLSLPERERTVLYLYYYQATPPWRRPGSWGPTPPPCGAGCSGAREKLKKLLEVDQNG